MNMYDRITELLKEKKINKVRLCEETGIPYSTLASMFQRQSTNIDVETIKKIALYLNTTLEYLVSGNVLISQNINHDCPNNTIIAITKSGQHEYKIQDDETMEAILVLIKKMVGADKL